MIRPSTLDALHAEVERARSKFPSNRHLLAALVEEVGELAKAFLEDEPRDRMRAEAIQAACVAVRIFEESDSTFAVPEAPEDLWETIGIDEAVRRFGAGSMAVGAMKGQGVKEMRVRVEPQTELQRVEAERDHAREKCESLREALRLARMA